MKATSGTSREINARVSIDKKNSSNALRFQKFIQKPLGTLFLTILKVFNYIMFTVECKPGYAGPNCSFNCPHPTYGDGCQGICECSKDECDSVTGCKPMSSGTSVC